MGKNPRYDVDVSGEAIRLSDIGMAWEDCIALTAYARSEDRTSAVLAGFQMHIAKPVETGELLAVVASLVGRV